MLAALALAATFVFQPFHVIVLAKDAAGDLQAIHPPIAFETRAKCEAWMSGEVARIEPLGDLVQTDEGFMEVLAMRCAASGQPA